MADKYLWGSHALQHGNAEGLKSGVFPSVRKGAVAAVAIAFIFAPQQVYTDVPSFVVAPLVSGKTPRTIPIVSGAPQLADLTQQAWIQPSVVGTRPRLIPLTTGAPQQVDLTQQAQFSRPPAQLHGAVPATTLAPPQSDPTQIAAVVQASTRAAAIIPNPVAPFFSVPPQNENRQESAIWASLRAGQTPVVIPSLYVWPTVPVSPQDDTSVNTSIVWTPSTFTPSAPVPPPVAPAATTGGGRWFGYYPTTEEKECLEREIRIVVRQKKAIERQLSFAPSREDLYELIERLNAVQRRLNALTTEYVYLVESWKTYRTKLDEEEEEFMLFISANL